MDTYALPDNGFQEIYGFDYSNPSHPRLVSLMGDGNAGDYTLALWASSNRLICACVNGVLNFDLTQPRNVIGTFPFRNSLKPPQDTGSIPPALRKGGGAFKFNFSSGVSAPQRLARPLPGKDARPSWTPSQPAK